MTSPLPPAAPAAIIASPPPHRRLHLTTPILAASLAASLAAPALVPPTFSTPAYRRHTHIAATAGPSTPRNSKRVYRDYVVREAIMWEDRWAGPQGEAARTIHE